MAERVVKVRLTAEVAEYATKMQEAASKTRTVGTEAERLAQKREAFQQLGAGLIVVGGAMTALSLAVAKTGIEYNTLQQTSRAALTTLLGSAEAANAQMDRLDEFARTSPFAKTTFIKAQQQMLAFGIEAKKVIPYLDAIQDAVAAAGGSNQQIEEIAFIMAQISSASKITAQDLMQFGQRGINAAELIGSQMGKTGAQIRAEITAGTLDADKALDALAAGMAEKFDGAAENVKNTLAGAFDRVQAAWRDLASDLMTPLVDPNGGGALVDILNWAADVMRAFQALPEPVKLTGGAMFALAGFVALVSGTILVATPRIVAMRAAFMTLSTTMRGIAIVGGGAVLALTAVVAVVAAVSAAHAEAEAKAQGYADALEQGADAARRLTADNLTAEKSFLWISRGSAADAAAKLGLSLDLVADAATGNAEALEQVNKAIDTAYAEAYTQSMKDVTDEQAAAGEAAAVLREALDAESAAYENGTKKLDQKNRMTDKSVDSSNAAADAYLATAGEVDDLNSKLSELIETMNESNNVNQDAVNANARWQKSLEGISAEVQSQRDAYEEAHGTLDGFSASLDQNTASGSANASMLAGVASDAQKAAASQLEVDKATMSSKDAADKYYGTLVSQRDAFIRSATAAGFNADEVQALADEVFKLPSKKDIDVVANTDTAEDKLRRLRDTLASIPGYRSVTLETIEIGNRIASPNFQGGLYESGVKHFASGGFPSGIYAGVQGGIRDRDRVFAEKEMGVPWETYISGRAQDRARNIGLWQKTGALLGVKQGGAGPVQVSLAGAEFTMLVDGNPVRAVVQEQIVAYDGARQRTTEGRLRGW